MCGRFTLTTPGDALAEAFGLDEPPDVPPRYNIAPTQPVAAVRRIPAGAPRSVSLLRWGLVPAWSREPRSRNPLINARAETLVEKPAFREAFERRRCLIPADGFYEWRHMGGEREAFLVRRADSRPFAFAGLWELPTERDPGVLGTCTIITTEPNELLRELHDRMPVILPPAAFEEWLRPEPLAAQRLDELLHPHPEAEMEAFPVSRRVNSPAYDGPECIAPLA